MTTYRGKQFVFVCDFDDDLDDYPEDYTVYLLPNIPESTVMADFRSAFSSVITHLGYVPVKLVKFDSTRRREIDTGVLDELIERVERLEQKGELPSQPPSATKQV